MSLFSFLATPPLPSGLQLISLSLLLTVFLSFHLLLRPFFFFFLSLSLPVPFGKNIYTSILVLLETSTFVKMTTHRRKEMRLHPVYLRKEGYEVASEKERKREREKSQLVFTGSNLEIE